MRNPKQHYDMLTALPSVPNIQPVDLTQSTCDKITHPLMVYVKSTLYSNIKGLCDLGKQISSP